MWEGGAALNVRICGGCRSDLPTVTIPLPKMAPEASALLVGAQYSLQTRVCVESLNHTECPFRMLESEKY